jgi:hypothetical protein
MDGVWACSLFTARFSDPRQVGEYFASLTLRARTVVHFKIGSLNQIELKTKSAIFKLAARERDLISG